jgi:dihydrofolate reductase
LLKEKMLKITFASPVFAYQYVKEDKSVEDGLVIGKGGDMPWRRQLPSDMARFVRLTSQPGENSLCMGRKTYLSIPEKFRPFDKDKDPESARQTIVITRNSDFVVNDPRVIVAHSLEEAVQLARSSTVWIAGGAEIYALALPVADEIHWTMIFEHFEGDTFFPEYDRSNWKSSFFRFFHAGEIGTEKDKVNSAYNILKREV